MTQTLLMELATQRGAELAGRARRYASTHTTQSTPARRTPARETRPIVRRLRALVSWA